MKRSVGTSKALPATVTQELPSVRPPCGWCSRRGECGILSSGGECGTCSCQGKLRLLARTLRCICMHSALLCVEGICGIGVHGHIVIITKKTADHMAVTLKSRGYHAV